MPGAGAAIADIMILAFDDYLTPTRRLAESSRVPLATVHRHTFPDGESLVRLPSSVPAHVFVVRSLHHANDKLVELMMVADAARELGASRVSLLAPYLCYMRQDAAFRPGEAISQRIVGRFLAAHFDDVITVDAHLHRVRALGEAVPARRAINLSAATRIGDFLRERLDEPFIVVGPDAESAQWAEDVARAANTECVVGAKRRRGDREVSVELPAHAYRGRRAVIVDDVASTGRTVLATAELLLQRGAKEVDAVVTHAVFVEGALAQLHAAGVGNVWSTDSIPHATNSIALAPLLAGAINTARTTLSSGRELG